MWLRIATTKVVQLHLWKTAPSRCPQAIWNGSVQTSGKRVLELQRAREPRGLPIICSSGNLEKPIGGQCATGAWTIPAHGERIDFDPRMSQRDYVPNPLPTLKPRSFLRWAGSKRQLLSTLTSHAGTEWTRYVEPFAGSACLFFALKPQRALLGDINKDLVLTYRQVKKAPAAVSSELRNWRKCKGTYLRLRAEASDHGSPVRRAARFIYLNRCCFNGIYRTNRLGRFNVPYGGNRSGDLPDESLLRACARSLRRARLCAGDFSQVLAQVVPGDFVYMDPPFSIRSRRMFKEYDAAMFGEDQLLLLRAWMDNLTERGIRWVVSYAMSDEAAFLRDGYSWSEVSVRRQVAGFSGDRKVSSECLIHCP